MEKEQATPNMSGSLLKGLALLEKLSLSRKPCGVAQLATAMAMSKGGVHRLLQTLKGAGWVRQTPEGTYECTLRIWEVGVRLVERGGLRPVALPHVRKLWEGTQETTYLAVLEGSDALYLEKIDSPQLVLASFRIGDRLPAFRVAAGRALLAFSEDWNLPPTDQTDPMDQTIRDSLRQDLARVRESGFSINNGELDQAINGIAAPVFDATGTAVASIGFSCPSPRLTPENLSNRASLVLQTARDLSRDLGYVEGHTIR